MAFRGFEPTRPWFAETQPFRGSVLERSAAEESSELLARLFRDVEFPDTVPMTDSDVAVAETYRQLLLLGVGDEQVDVWSADLPAGRAAPIGAVTLMLLVSPKSWFPSLTTVGTALEPLLRAALKRFEIEIAGVFWKLHVAPLELSRRRQDSRR